MHLFQEARGNCEKDDKIVIFRKDLRKDILLGSEAEKKKAGVYFAVSDAPKEIGAWDSRLQVSSRGYMLGYNDLKDPSIGGFFRLLAKVGDGMMKMQIVKINF